MATINGTNRSETLAGKAEADTINALGGDDFLFGGAGNDKLFGGTGGDELEGGLGNDLLDGGTGIGVDTAEYHSAKTGVGVNLLTGAASDGLGGTDTLVSIENVDGSGFGDTIIGDQVGNFLKGNGGADFISANGGNDTILGGDGSDTILGGSGADKISGDRGADIMTGGSEADSFLFYSFNDVGIGSGFRDVIRDFEKGLDKIDLSVLDANPALSGNQAFTFVGGSAFNDEGQIRAVAQNGGTLLQFNTAGNTVTDFEIFLETPVQVSASDFFL
jgi:serralysin